MKYKIMLLTMFTTGALAGSFFTWYTIKDKYEKIAQEEIDSVKEKFSEMHSYKKDEDKNELAEEDLDKNETAEFDYHNLANKYNAFDHQEEEEEDDYMNKPYVITPEEFDEMDDYESVSLSYYSDGILAETISNEIVEDIKETVGNFKNHFGEYEDDSVFIRNDKIHCDFEILKDERTYDEVVNEYI